LNRRTENYTSRTLFPDLAVSREDFEKQVQEQVRRALGLKQIPRPNHAADALAAALCHYFVLTKKDKPINKKKLLPILFQNS